MIRNFFVAVLTLFLFSSFGLAATHVVTKSIDTNDAVCDGDCSLREAVAVSVAGDVIEFGSIFTTPQTIILSLGEINIGSNVTINGTGISLLTISGNDTNRSFLVPKGVTVTFNDLRIIGGRTADKLGGGAISSEGAINVNRCMIENNSASESGGGISSVGLLTITDSTIRSNTALDEGAGASGGGIFTRGDATIRNSTISNNSATDTGKLSEGGGIYSRETLNVLNSTISGNTATSGGGIYTRNTGNLINTTIANNTATADGGGYYFERGTVTSRNTIFARNTAGGTAPDYFGTVVSQGSNLISNTTGSSGWVASDRQNVSANIGPLASNGGRTQTHALIFPSQAIDTGDSCVLTTCTTPALTRDQRGFPRQVDGGTFAMVLRVDIGAYEFQGPTAAPGEISGRIFDFHGKPLSRALIQISDEKGNLKISRSTAFGYYRFDELLAGESYVIMVFARGHLFEPRILNFSESITDLDFYPIK